MVGFTSTAPTLVEASFDFFEMASAVSMKTARNSGRLSGRRVRRRG
jgi:hypothetical protein